MRLWTIKESEIADLLLSGKPYHCNPELSDYLHWEGEPDEMFFTAYKWMNNQMANRIGGPPENVMYPAWAWKRRDNEEGKPDIFWYYEDDEEDLEPDLVIIELEIPENRVLLSDFIDWHSVINDHPIFTDEENEVVEEYWANLHDNSYPAPTFMTEDDFKVESWNRIFDVKDSTDIQACMWEILP